MHILSGGECTPSGLTQGKSHVSSAEIAKIITAEISFDKICMDLLLISEIRSEIM